MDITGIAFTFPGLTSVKCFFQTRHGGASLGAYGGGNISYATKDAPKHILRNRQALEAHIGKPIIELSQVHGDGLIFDPQTATPCFAEKGPSYEADGHATAKKNCALMIKTADCQPILLTHKEGTHIMALHVGWRGNRIGFIATAIRRFCDQYALKPADLMAVRGPSLGPAMAEFIHFDKEWGPEYEPWFTPQNKTMNLWHLTRHQLQQAGLRDDHIFGIDLCTATMHNDFFSYRKEKESGRQASLIWRV